jgi:hypothetical protein
MSNSFYNHGAFPSTGSAATSASMRAELDLVAAGFDKMPTLSGNANKFIIVNSTGTALTQTDVLPAFTVTDTDFTVQDDGDNTRKFQFNAGSITTGNTRVYVMPDLDTTLVGTNVTQTLTNKTLTAPVIATIVNTGTLTLPTSTDTLVGRNTTDTLTNKTLTNPVIGTIVNTGTLTLPTSTDTLVGRQTTDTLTNKTISGASNTLSNIANGSLSNSSIVIGSTTLSLGGTMTTLAGVTISGASNTLSNIANASLTNSSITINGSTVALGSSVTVTATATNALTIGNGLSGTSYNGSAAVTIAINTGVTADLSTAQTFSNKTISGSANTLSNIANASLTNSAITIGSTAISLGATSLTLAGLTSASATTLISTGNQATSVAISAIGHSSGTVTVTTGTAHGLTTGDVASIDGVADYTFCGVYTVTVTNANVFTYSQTASGASSSGGFSTKLSGTWGLYAGGTGPSLANGPVMINASSQLPALRVTQGGNGYALIVEDAANPDTSAFIISNAGDLTINTNKFTVAAASGNTVIAGTTSLNGNVTFATDATYDIGASGATRPRDLFLSRNLTVGGTLTLAGGVNLNGNVTIGDASTDTLTINSTITSNLIFTDNTYDIGASGATRPRTGYFGTSVITPLIDATNLEVTNIKALDGTASITLASSTGVASFTANPILSGGTANSVVYLNGSKVATSGSVLTFDGANLGVAITPNSWTTYKVVQVGWGALASYNAADTAVFSNAYFEGGGWKYIGNGFASQYRQLSGVHTWQTAQNNSSGAGAAIAFNTGMSLSASAELYIDNGTGGGRLTFVPNAAQNQILSTTTLFGAYNLLRHYASQYQWFNAASSQMMTLTADTNLLVGATAPFNVAADVGLFAKAQAGVSRVLIDNQNSTGISSFEMSSYGGGWSLQVPGSTVFSNALNFKFGSTQRVRFGASGNIGFGTQGTTGDRLIDASFAGATLDAGSNQFGLVLNPTYATNVTATIFNIYAGPNLTAGTTVNNVYSLYLEGINAVGSTINVGRWGVYQTGSSDNNYFAGMVRIGSQSTNAGGMGAGTLQVGNGFGGITNTNSIAPTILTSGSLEFNLDGVSGTQRHARIYGTGSTVGGAYAGGIALQYYAYDGSSTYQWYTGLSMDSGGSVNIPRGTLSLTSGVGYGSSAGKTFYIGADNDQSVNNGATYLWNIRVTGDATGQPLQFWRSARNQSDAKVAQFDGDGDLTLTGGVIYNTGPNSGYGLNNAGVYSYNDNNANSIGGGANSGFILINISQGLGNTVIPIFANAGGGVAWSMSAFDPDTGTFVYGSAPTVSFGTNGTGANSYTLAINSGSAQMTIQRTAGTSAYTVSVQVISS